MVVTLCLLVQTLLEHLGQGLQVDSPIEVTVLLDLQLDYPTLLLLVEQVEP